MQNLTQDNSVVKAISSIHKMSDGMISLKLSDINNNEKTILMLEQQLRKDIENIEAKHIEEVEHIQNAQIAFLMDCTSSMQPYINEAKDTILRLHNKILSMFGKAVVSFAFVGYRDYNDKPPVIVDFTSAEIFKTNIQTVKASGGADTCENVYDGLDKLSKLGWNKYIPTKLIFWITDAPSHGVFFHGKKSASTTYDSQPNFDSEGKHTKKLLQYICLHCNIDIFFLKINNDTDTMIMMYNKLLEKKNIHIAQLKNATDFFDIVSNTTIETITKNTSRISTDNKKMKVIERAQSIVNSIKNDHN